MPYHTIPYHTIPYHTIPYTHANRGRRTYIHTYRQADIQADTERDTGGIHTCIQHTSHAQPYTHACIHT